MKLIHQNVIELHEKREKAANRQEMREIGEKQILMLLDSEGPMTVPDIAKALDLNERTVLRYMAH